MCQDLNTLDGFNIAVEILGFNFFVLQILGKILGHFFGECCGDNAETALYCSLCLDNKILDLAAVSSHHPFIPSLGRRGNTLKNRPDNHFGINETSRTNDLFDDAFTFFLFVIGRSCRCVNHLPNTLFKFWIFERAVILCRWQSKTEFNQCIFSRLVAGKHGAELWHSHMRFIDNGEKIWCAICLVREI